MLLGAATGVVTLAMPGRSHSLVAMGVGDEGLGVAQSKPCLSHLLHRRNFLQTISFASAVRQMQRLRAHAQAKRKVGKKAKGKRAHKEITAVASRKPHLHLHQPCGAPFCCGRPARLWRSRRDGATATLIDTAGPRTALRRFSNRSGRRNGPRTRHRPSHHNLCCARALWRFQTWGAYFCRAVACRSDVVPWSCGFLRVALHTVAFGTASCSCVLAVVGCVPSLATQVPFWSTLLDLGKRVSCTPFLQAPA